MLTIAARRVDRGTPGDPAVEPGRTDPEGLGRNNQPHVFFKGRLAPAAITVLSAFGRLELQPSTHGSDITTVTLYDTSFREGASTTPCAIGRRLEQWSATSISLRAV